MSGPKRLLNPADFSAEKMRYQLESALEEDKLYWIRNEAKIRASMTSQTYDEFRDIVAAAHLKPLDKKDKSSKANIGWNKCVSTAQNVDNNSEIEENPEKLP